MSLKKTLLMFIVLTLSVLVFLKIDSKPSSNPIYVSKAKFDAINASVFTTGHVIFTKEAKLSAEVVAKVTNVFVTEGQSVKKGQPILQLDDSEIIKNIKQRKIATENAKLKVARSQIVLQSHELKLQRASRMVKMNLSQQSELDDAKTDFLLAKNDVDYSLNALEQSLTQLALEQDKTRKTLIVSPIDGIIVRLSIKEGETVVGSALNVAGSNFAVVADPESYMIKAVIPEYDVARVDLNKKAHIFLSDQPSIPINAKVLSMGAMLNTSSNEKQAGNKLDILLDFDFDDKKIIAGMSCEIELFEGQKEQALTIPISALQYDEEKADSKNSYIKGSIKRYFVYILKGDSIITKQPVKIGIPGQDNQEILSGIAINDRVISGPATIFNKLEDGMNISSFGLQVEVIDE